MSAATATAADLGRLMVGSNNDDDTRANGDDDGNHGDFLAAKKKAASPGDVNRESIVAGTAMDQRQQQYAVKILKQNIYVNRKRRKLHPDDVMVCNCRADGDGAGCGEDCLNRMLCVECDPDWCPCGDRCANSKFGRKEYSDVALLPPSGPKGYGLCTREALQKGGFIIEYVGEVISEDEYFQRKEGYQCRGQKHYYFMSLSNGEVIDATTKGNLSRFLNHSCNPNCETQKWQVGGELCIGIFAKRDIAAGEELTFDYHFERYGEEALKCFCGEETCRGFIGAGSREDEASVVVESPGSDDYDPALEPKPVWVKPTEAEEKAMAAALASPSATQQQQKRRGAQSIKRSANRTSVVPSGGRRGSPTSNKRQTDVERLLEEVAGPTGGVKDRRFVLNILQILKPNYGRFELSMMMDVVLKTPTKAVKEEFVKCGVLRVLQVLISEFRTDKQYYPLLRKALMVASGLPIKREVIYATQTAAMRFDEALIRLTLHEQGDVANMAKALAKKHLPEEYEEHMAKQAAEKLKQMESRRNYLHQHRQTRTPGHAQQQGDHQAAKPSSNSNNGGGGGYRDRDAASLASQGRGANLYYYRERDQPSEEDWDKRRFDSPNKHRHYDGRGDERDQDFVSRSYGGNSSYYYSGYDRRDKHDRRDSLDDNRYSDRHDDGYDRYDERYHHGRGEDVAAHPDMCNKRQRLSGNYGSGNGEQSQLHHTPAPPDPVPHASAEVTLPPHLAGSGNGRSTADQINFKNIEDTYMWKEASNEFRSVVRQIIRHRVKRLSKHQCPSLNKQEAKMSQITDKLTNRVLKKEVEKFDGTHFLLHSDLVHKVDHYARSHLKYYSTDK